MRSAIKLALGLLAVLVLLPAAGAAAKVIKVRPGQSIQAAVERANPGDTVQIEPGTYTSSSTECPPRPSRECAVSVTRDDISIVGKDGGHGRKVVLEAEPGQNEGIAVGREGSGAACLEDPSLRLHGSLIKGVTVTGFEDDGILLSCVADWRITQVAAIDNEEYGIFPSHVFDGRLDHSFASGANDTGIYIGQSFDSRVDHNSATGNVSGFELENSIGIRADHNLSFGNTGGILSFTLPFLDAKVNRDNLIDHNIVSGNNRPNTCSEPGDDVCQVPAGTGILLTAADENTVTGNRVTGNDSFGIAVTNICNDQELPEEVCAALDIQPDSDGNKTIGNLVTGNGHDPGPQVPPPLAVDLAWDGTGSGNCWSRNVFETSFPAPLPAC
jgi:parallel beta-helix repeat protein